MVLTRIIWICALCASAYAAISTAKGFFCRDPDTGKLYPVNATWPSSSFCGSYTCTLRKRNLTDTEMKNKFWRQQNFTAESLLKDITTENMGKETNSTKVLPLSKTNVTRQEIEALLRRSQEQNKTILEPAEKLDHEKIDEDLNNDRYLSDAEVKTLSVILKTLKKSDLEAILEVYSLAQDIYKEMDKESDDNIVVEALKTMDVNKKSSGETKKRIGHKHSKSGKKHASYWYEPLSAPKPKDTVVTAAVHVKTPDGELPKDMNFEGSEIFPHVVIAHPNHPPVQMQSSSITKPPPRSDAANYFSGPINPNEFSKLPYYYPITSFQRGASYQHPPVSPVSYAQNVHTYPTPSVNQVVTITGRPPCHHAHSSQQPMLPTWYTHLMTRHPSPEPVTSYIHVHVPVENRPVTPPIQVPYPVAYVQYNLTAPNPYFNGNPWQFFNLHSQHRPRPYVPLGTAFVAHVPNAVLVNPEINEDIQDIEQKPVKEASSNEVPSLLDTISTAIKKPRGETLFPDWQTSDLSANILNDIKANVKAKLSPFPLRKKVKLERVGKVIKLDESSRHKRAIDNEYKDKSEVGEEYEVFIQKSMCQTDTEPGFFRVGNMTQPFPGCCPQRIS